MNLREALELIAEQCEEHPLYLPDATDADLEREGGDAASVTYWAQTARDALRASPGEAVEPQCYWDMDLAITICPKHFGPLTKCPNPRSRSEGK